MGFTRRIDTDLPYDEAVTATKGARQQQGFGILAEIDEPLRVCSPGAAGRRASDPRRRVLGYGQLMVRRRRSRGTRGQSS